MTRRRHFPPKSEFFDCAGIPVACEPGPPQRCTAWDVDPPRPFPPRAAAGGTPLAESAFWDLVEEADERRRRAARG